MCLFTFVAFRVTFDGLCCWMQLCGLLSLLPLKVANQSWHTGPNETVLHFQVVFVISWHQIGELVLVFFWTVSLILHKIQKTSSKVRYVNTLKQTFQLKGLPCMFLYDIFTRLLAKICLNASFIGLSRFIAFCVTSNDLWCWTQRCGLLSRIHLKVIDESWHTGPNEFVLQLEVVFVVCWLETGKLVLVVFCAVSLILLKLHKTSF